MERKSTRLAEILLVEDNPGDIMLAREAFEGSRICNQVAVATDGEMALSVLRREGEYADRIQPDIILLDLNLPKIDGRELLKQIRQDSRLKHIPVIVLTSSKVEADIVRTYHLQANNYIVKPVNLEKFSQAIEGMPNFCFSLRVIADLQV